MLTSGTTCHSPGYSPKGHGDTPYVRRGVAYDPASVGVEVLGDRSASTLFEDWELGCSEGAVVFQSDAGPGRSDLGCGCAGVQR